MLKLIKQHSQKASAALVTGLIMGMPSLAMAAEDFNAYSKRVTESTSNIPDIINFVCYAGGAGLAGLGVLGVKQHVDQGGAQVPLKKPVAQLITGGALLGFPTVAAMVQGTADSQGAVTAGGFVNPTSIGG